MQNNILSLREYINKRKQINSVKIHTFCCLMKLVSDAIEKEERNLIIINLDDIKINIETGEIVFTENLFQNEDLDKTMASFNTGVSLMADRKSSLENKRVAFALMVLGWYYNEDGTSVNNDLNVLENFDLYMSKVPTWLQEFFINIFKRMNYQMSFGEYYKKNFTDKIKEEIKNTLLPYNLNDDQLQKISSLIARETNLKIKEGDPIV